MHRHGTPNTARTNASYGGRFLVCLDWMPRSSSMHTKSCGTTRPHTMHMHMHANGERGRYRETWVEAGLVSTRTRTCVGEVEKCASGNSPALSRGRRRTHILGRASSTACTRSQADGRRLCRRCNHNQCRGWWQQSMRGKRTRRCARRCTQSTRSRVDAAS